MTTNPTPDLVGRLRETEKRLGEATPGPWVGKCDLLAIDTDSASTISALEARVAELEMALSDVVSDADQAIAHVKLATHDQFVNEWLEKVRKAQAALRASEATAGREMRGQESSSVMSKPVQTVSSEQSKES